MTDFDIYAILAASINAPAHDAALQQRRPRTANEATHYFSQNENT